MFDQSTFRFLSALSDGRDKAWFDANRAIYEASLIAPLRELVGVVGGRLVKLDPSFEITPQVNKTLTRVNRDMRFAKGQSPYKDHMLALFYRQGRKKQDPQLFVGLQPREAWIGLYVGPHLLAEDAPIRAVIQRSPTKLLDAAGKAGLGKLGGFELATCERYGEVKAVLGGKDAADFARGPHLVVLRRVPAGDIVKAGGAFVTDCAERLQALFPLWSLYAG
jgi:uncharacterized protein (TIGR02453 family)